MKLTLLLLIYTSLCFSDTHIFGEYGWPSLCTHEGVEKVCHYMDNNGTQEIIRATKTLDGHKAMNNMMDKASEMENPWVVFLASGDRDNYEAVQLGVTSTSQISPDYFFEPVEGHSAIHVKCGVSTLFYVNVLSNGLFHIYTQGFGSVRLDLLDGEDNQSENMKGFRRMWDACITDSDVYYSFAIFNGRYVGMDVVFDALYVGQY